MTNVSFPGLGIGPFTMNRFLIRTESVSVAWYGVIICAAMILAAVLILWMATKKEGFVLDSFLDYFIFTIPLGVIGARAMYVLTNLDIYPTLRSAIAVWEGGLAVYGGILTGIVTLFVIAKIKKHNPLVVFDTVVAGVMVAQAIGRWGNFVNGEAHGVVTALPWGMMIGGEGPFHPTFLYESLLNLVGAAIVIFFLYPRKKFNGEIFLFYLIWYGIGRTLIEGLRTDSLYVGTLRLAQCIGVTTAVFGIVFMILFAVWTKKGIFQRALAVRGADPAPAESAALMTDVTQETEEMSTDANSEQAVREEEKGE